MNAKNLMDTFMVFNYNIKNTITGYTQISDYVIILELDDNLGLEVKFNPVTERFEILNVGKYSDMLTE